MLNFFFGFHGRIRRTHYFLGALATGLIHGVVVAHWLHVNHVYWFRDYTAFDPIGMTYLPGFWLVGGVLAIGCLWAKLALTVKRWHDVGTTGWLTILSFVWGVDWIIFLLLCLIPPTKGANQYGADPRIGAQAFA